MGDCGHNRHGPKRGGAAVPFSRELAGTPSSTMWPGHHRHREVHPLAILFVTAAAVILSGTN